ncbi:MAG: hypothetical protein LLG06_19700 [Desulfobacteraceae bacterium]|nr:hypothetical protein [Desulfobacteraceae bacterium]
MSMAGEAILIIVGFLALVFLIGAALWSGFYVGQRVTHFYRKGIGDAMTLCETATNVEAREKQVELANQEVKKQRDEAEARKEAAERSERYQWERDALQGEIGAMEAPVYRDDPNRGELGEITAQQEFAQMTGAYVTAIKSVSGKIERLRDCYDRDIAAIYARHGMIDTAMAFERHAASGQRGAAAVVPAVEGVNLGQATGEDDPYSGPMYGPAGRVSTVEG